MEEEDNNNNSFDLRVKRLFGSKLFETVPKNSFPSSSWSVADGQVEKKEWNRERPDSVNREDDPCSSAFYDEAGCLSRKKKSSRDKQREFEGNLGDDDDDLEDEEEEETRGGHEEEEEEIRSSIGRDPTLDNEDEEDEFDKAALCRENASERLYMSDIKDHGPYLNFHSIIPDFPEEPAEESHHFRRDPRANHSAANVRLKEDASAAETFPSLPTHKEEEGARDLRVKITEDDVNLKPILKRKEVQIDSKPKKRVRFDPGCKHESNDVSVELPDFPMVPQSMETNEGLEARSYLPEESPSVPNYTVPDYIKNPSKYTCYTFDSSEKDDDETNKRAFQDFLKLVKRSNPERLEPEFPVDPPKSVTFTPRKKSSDAVPMDDSPGNTYEESGKESGHILTRTTVIAAVEGDGSDACEMEEDVTDASMVETNVNVAKGRQYRSKSISRDDSN